MVENAVLDKEEERIAEEHTITDADECAGAEESVEVMTLNPAALRMANFRLGVLVLDDSGYLVPVVTAADLLHECKQRWRAAL